MNDDSPRNNGGDQDFPRARRNFEEVWNPRRSRTAKLALDQPSVSKLLELDREYCERLKKARSSSDRSLNILESERRS